MVGRWFLSFLKLPLFMGTILIFEGVFNSISVYRSRVTETPQLASWKETLGRFEWPEGIGGWFASSSSYDSLHLQQVKFSPGKLSWKRLNQNTVVSKDFQGIKGRVRCCKISKSKRHILDKCTRCTVTPNPQATLTTTAVCLQSTLLCIIA